MVPEVKALPQMNAFVPIALVILCQRRQHSQLNPRSISILLYRSDDLNSALGALVTVHSLNDLTKGALAQ
jgi:hypothetical protein